MNSKQIRLARSLRKCVDRHERRPTRFIPTVVADEPAALHQLRIAPSVWRTAPRFANKSVPPQFRAPGIAWRQTDWNAKFSGGKHPVYCVRLRDVHGCRHTYLATHFELCRWLNSLPSDARSGRPRDTIDRCR